MKNDLDIEKMVEETMNSVEGIHRAPANPYLFTRIQARLANSRESIWERTAGVISRPSVLVAGLCLVILLNVIVIRIHSLSKRSSVAEQLAIQQPDEYNTTVATIYDIENIEP